MSDAKPTDWAEHAVESLSAYVRYESGEDGQRRIAVIIGPDPDPNHALMALHRTLPSNDPATIERVTKEVICAMGAMLQQLATTTLASIAYTPAERAELAGGLSPGQFMAQLLIAETQVRDLLAGVPTGIVGGIIHGLTCRDAALRHYLHVLDYTCRQVATTDNACGLAVSQAAPSTQGGGARHH